MENHCHEPWNDKLVEKFRQLRSLEESQKRNLELYSQQLKIVIEETLKPVLDQFKGLAERSGYSCSISNLPDPQSVAITVGRLADPAIPHLQVTYNWNASPVGFVLTIEGISIYGSKTIEAKRAEEISRDLIAEQLTTAMSHVIESEQWV